MHARMAHTVSKHRDAILQLVGTILERARMSNAIVLNTRMKNRVGALRV